jgi:CheY-like chemotaxis protein/HPt (histidine-containing phosphotransfer) domain-containing protein
MGGGEIQLESTPGKGSIFSFKVIFSIPPNSKPAIERLQLDSALRGTQTLLVSTNETSCNITRKTLEAMRLKTATASSAVEAFEKITDADKNNTPFGLIIIDWWPSGIDEIETARHIRQMHLSNSPRLVLISSRKHELDEATVHDAGFSICINRPVHPSMLFNAIMQAFHSVIAPGKVPAKRHKELKDVKILLAEDNEFNRQVELELLQGAGAIVSVVYNGREAVEAVKTQDFDLVLMDVQMPEMDGMEATLRIRDTQSTVLDHNIPIIAMTANAMQGDRERILKTGMNDYVAKPIDPQKLAEALNHWLPVEAGQDVEKENHSSKIEKAASVGEQRSLFNKAAFLNRLMGDEELAAVVLAGYVEDIPHQIQSLKDHLKQGDAKGAERQAHTIKGASANISSDRLQAIAHEMEKSGKAGNLSAIQDRMGELELQFDALKDLLRKESIK